MFNIFKSSPKNTNGQIISTIKDMVLGCHALMVESYEKEFENTKILLQKNTPEHKLNPKQTEFLNEFIENKNGDFRNFDYELKDKAKEMLEGNLSPEEMYKGKLDFFNELNIRSPKDWTESAMIFHDGSSEYAIQRAQTFRRYYEHLKKMQPDYECALVYHNHFKSILNLLEFYHKKLGNWDDDYSNGSWARANHPRKEVLGIKSTSIDACISELQPQFESVRLELLQGSDPIQVGFSVFRYFYTPFGGGARMTSTFSKRLLLELLLIFDCYTYAMWNHLLYTTIENNFGDSPHYKSNEFFIDNFSEEFEDNFGVTKNMLVETFLNNVGVNQIEPSFRKFFKTLVKWRIPFNKSFTCFPDGKLEFPIVYDNSDYALQTRHTFGFFVGGSGTDFAPTIFVEGKSQRKPSMGRKYQLAIPHPLDNPKFENSSKLIELLPEKYQKEKNK